MRVLCIVALEEELQKTFSLCIYGEGKTRKGKEEARLAAGLT